MTSFTDHFAPVAVDYGRHRPGYPPALYAWLASRAPHQALAWDCATGTGQAARGLAAHFRRVLATDASEAQIRAAEALPGVDYRVAPDTECPADDGSVALVTVAQALHWFNGEPFHRELRRVLSPGGLLAAWSYGRLETGVPELDALLRALHDETLGPWWPPERRHVLNGYRDLALPFEPLETPDFAMHRHWNLPQLLGYQARISHHRSTAAADLLAVTGRAHFSRLDVVSATPAPSCAPRAPSQRHLDALATNGGETCGLGTWSAVARCREATGQDPLADLAAGLAARWGDP
ncbi:class I SAM-dependent methyltransferase, partial [Thioalkalivibrio sulfidiphilus]|uniref:class I SAM-dependent methyltransferase n=1 Tax=Thioalkalivibrio sulfidiphilus TaxID=1033854 RepID=UPI00047553D7